MLRQFSRHVAMLVLGAMVLFLVACQSDDDSAGGVTTSAAETSDQTTTGTTTVERRADPAGVTGASSIWNVPNKTPEDVAEYWTPERMENAKPVETPATEGRPGPKASEEENGPTVTIDGKASGSAAPAGGKEAGARIPNPRRLPAPYAYRRYAWPGTSTALPARTSGKVFFSKGGEDWVCSGTVVASTNTSVVWTAGHCVVELNKWHLNWIFVPGYRNGKAPYGRWKVRGGGAAMYSINGWMHDENWRYDVGAVILARNGAGKSIGDVVGYQGITFNAPAGKRFWSFGYPAGSPFNGQYLYACDARLGARPAPTDRNDRADGPPMLAIGCDLTGGSSGGSWLIGLNKKRGWGWVNSVNSSGPRTVMWGPYHGKAAHALWIAVQGL